MESGRLTGCAAPLFHLYGFSTMRVPTRIGSLRSGVLRPTPCTLGSIRADMGSCWLVGIAAIPRTWMTVQCSSGNWLTVRVRNRIQTLKAKKTEIKIRSLVFLLKHQDWKDSWISHMDSANGLISWVSERPALTAALCPTTPRRARLSVEQDVIVTEFMASLKSLLEESDLASPSKV